MLPFKLIYSDAYFLPIGQHVFPAEKYRLITRRLREKGIAGNDHFLTPQPAHDHDVLLAHSDYYVHKLLTGTLTAREELEMEIPFSDELVGAFWLNAGGSILAARQSLQDRICINLGGGFHHAFPDHGEGFCMINDVAIAIRVLQRDKLIERAMVVDCDVHQGNGTAVIFGRRPQSDEGVPPPSPVVTRDQFAWMRASPGTPSTGVFTLSLHQENNYPAWKPPSSLDVNFADATPDQPYLDWLSRALDLAFASFQPQLIAYVAGADPYREDQLGGLNLTIDGLRRRDDLVFALARDRRIPIFVTLAGGYARNLEDTVTIHCNTVLSAEQTFSQSV
jgi:acetoin utilization deacetylase AcuC-like enzyme